jgi:hypothetical protein
MTLHTLNHRKRQQQLRRTRLRNNQSELARLIDLIGYNQVNQSKLALYKFKHVANQFNLQDED